MAQGTVGIVVVSHSYRLATAAVELARQMAQSAAPAVAVAAGLDPDTLGTDAVQIQAAIEEVDSPTGVLVLMDLGSAVLSTELALDFLASDLRDRVMLCAAPLVEGLIVALVTAAGGSPLATVCAEASEALAGKQAQLTAPPAGPAPSALPAAVPSAPPAPAPAGGAERARAVLVVDNPHGLHARPAARLVGALREQSARVTLRNLTTGAGPVAASSLSRVTTLGALAGHQLEVIAEGRQAQAAVDAVLALAAQGFGEQPGGAERGGAGRAAGPGEAEPAAGPGGAEPVAGPLPAAPGVAVGPAWSPQPAPAEVPEGPAGDPDHEWLRLTEAMAKVRKQTRQLREQAARELGEPQAEIFDAHLLLLDDAALLDPVRERLDTGASAEVGWAAAARGLAEALSALPDPYQRARAVDARAVGEQVLHALRGTSATLESRDGVLIAADLAPAEVSRLDPAKVAGVVLGYGSPTAHGAILARALGIPMVVAAGPGVLTVAEGTPVALDGGTGELAVDPDPATRERFAARAARAAQRAAAARRQAGAPARTSDGVLIEVAANLGSVPDAFAARAAGADGAGLVRTEFLFLDRDQAPPVAEQEQTYRQIVEAFDGRRVTLRTLDAGGDKPLPYLPVAAEANPFLGLRGIRLSLARRQLLYDQLVAMCRVARQAPIGVMFPMVSTLTEVYAARAVLDEAIAATGRGRPAGLEVGIMIEVPAAALKAAMFAPHVDFFSIGTNDLTQYALAVERGNPAVAALSDPLDPGVLQLIDAVCRAAAGRVRVAVCGEAGADEAAIPLLIGLGVRELSVAPPAVPAVKQTVRTVDAGAAARAVPAALTGSPPPRSPPPTPLR